MIADILASVEIEIAVPGKIDDRRSVARCAELDDEAHGLDHSIGAHRIDGGRIAFFSRRRMERQAYRLIRGGFDTPRFAIEPDPAAMEMSLAAFVAAQLIGFAVEGEAPAHNAVGVTSGDRSDIGSLIEISRKRVEAEHHRPRLAVHLDNELAQDRAMGDDAGIDAIIADCDLIDFPSAGQSAKDAQCHSSLPIPIAGRRAAG